MVHRPVSLTWFENEDLGYELYVRYVVAASIQFNDMAASTSLPFLLRSDVEEVDFDRATSSLV